MRSLARLGFAFLLVALAPGARTARSATLQEIIRDTQAVRKTGTHVRLVWWVPYYYWASVLSESPSLTVEGRKQVLEALSHYNFMFVVDANVDEMGAFTFRPEPEILSNSSLKLNGLPVAMVADANIPGPIKALLAAMKPLLSSAMGPMGKAMIMEVFPGQDDASDPPWEVTKGKLTFALDGQTFDWRLPLGSALPNKQNPKTGDSFPGNYNFDPYTGEPLK